MWKFIEAKKRAVILIILGSVIFLALHLGESFIIPSQTPSFLRLLFKSVPFLGIITGIFFLFSEPEEKNKALGK